MLVKKLVYGFRPLEGDTIAAATGNSAQALGSLLYMRSREKNGSADILMDTYTQAKTISINTDCIVFECSCSVQEYLPLISLGFMLDELGKNDTARSDEYDRYILKVCEEQNIKAFEFKIVKIGGNEYTFFTI